MVYQKPNILIVDDEQVVCKALSDELNEQGYLCFTALDGNEAIRNLAERDFDLALLDIKLPGISGIELLKRISTRYPNTAAIMITCVNDVNTAVEAIKIGATDYITKPFDLDRVEKSIKTALNNKKPSSARRDKQTTQESFKRMDAIAYGVEANLDLFLNYSKLVTQRTIDIARRFNLLEGEIQGWAAAREMYNSERESVIKPLLERLQQNPLAQRMIGMTDVYLYRPESDESEN